MKEHGGRINMKEVIRLRVRNQIWYFCRHFPVSIAARRILAYLAFDFFEATYRKALNGWTRGVLDAWREREAIHNQRTPIDKNLLNRVELNRGRLHIQLLFDGAKRLGFSATKK